MSIALQSVSSLTHVHAELNFSGRHLLISLPNYKTLFSNINNYSAIIHNYSIQQPKMAEQIIDSSQLRSDFLQVLRSRRTPEGNSVSQFFVFFLFFVFEVILDFGISFSFVGIFFFLMILWFCILSSSCIGAWESS